MSLVILDRDGVINIDSADYIKSAEEWQPIEGSIEAIALICSKGYKVYVATNQAGLARGLFEQDQLDSMHEKLKTLVAKAGGSIEAIMFCPHHPKDGCACRKPKTGLLDQIQTHSKEDLEDQFFVGDSLKDVQAALSANAKPALVLTGNGQQTLKDLNDQQLEEQVIVFNDLKCFSEWLEKAD